MRAPMSSGRVPRLSRRSLSLARLTVSISCVGTVGVGYAQTDNRHVEEVIVTAQKTQERLQDVPVPVTVVSSESLTETNQLRLQDYYTEVPGLSMILGGDHGGPQIAIRGITTGGATSPTVATIIDDIPFGPSTIEGYANIAPDLDPSDLQHVEVLRGPQGTLYGASSLGGLIKYVTIDPSTEGLQGTLQVGSTAVKNGDGVGHTIRGGINVPISDTFAIRASGYSRRDPGYIDNVQTGEKGVNQVDSLGGTVSALWEPSERFSMKLKAIYQDSEADGSSEIHRLAGLADLQQASLRRTGWSDRKVQAFNATLKTNVGAAQITSLSSYSEFSLQTNIDGSPVVGFLSDEVFGVPGVVSAVGPVETEKFSQELRVALPLGGRVDWMIGAFYTQEEVPQLQDIYAADLSGRKVGSLLLSRGDFSFEEFAAFTNLTFKLNDRVDLQVGGRISENRQENGPTTIVGPWNTVLLGLPSETVLVPKFRSKDDPVTYLITPRFKVSDDLMVYARFASGYRPGGPNVYAGGQADVPTEFSADTTQNYEIGLKGNVGGGLVAFDASVYYVDWKDIQLQLRDADFASYTANGGSAKSQGVELSLQVNPLDRMSMTASVSWSDAELTEDFPANSTAAGVEGERLPYSARFTGDLTLTQEVPLTDQFDALVGASFSYIGDRVGKFQGTPQRELFPSYTQLDLRAGIKYQSWKVDAFINNVADKRGVIRGGLDAPFADYPSYNYIQPRTLGVSLTKSFE